MHVVITGASHGIGAASALAFANLPGARLTLVARREQMLKAVAGQCRELGAAAQVVTCDVTDADKVSQMAASAVQWAGTPAVLLNNAGRFAPSTVAETPVAEFLDQISVNLVSAYLVTHAFLPSMIAARSGTMFFMCSVASLRAYPTGAAYCTAKHGLLGLARSVREEGREHGLRVTAVLPGATWTPTWSGIDLPEERFMRAEDVASAMVHCWQLSDRAVVEELVLRPQLGDI